MQFAVEITKRTGIFPNGHMKIFRILALLGLTSFSAACSMDSGVASRNAPLEGGFAQGGVAYTRDYAVRDIRVTVPEELTVSEANSYKPRADIVWRGDAYGNRHQQIAAMFETAAERGAERKRGNTPVIVDVELTRFHGLTEKTRFSFGGDYDIHYVITVRNANSGEVIEPARLVAHSLDGPGGDRAMELERAGQTEKVRVVDFMTQKFMLDLATPQLGA